MKKRTKIITTSCALILASAVLGVGIYAASSVNLKSGNGTLTFSANDVLATVQLANNEGTSFVIDTTAKVIGADHAGGDESWNCLGSHDFAKKDDALSFTISVENNFADGSNILVGSTLTHAIGGDDAAKFSCSVTATLGGTDVTDTAIQQEVAVGSPLVYTVTISYISDVVDIAATADFSFSLALERITE